MRYKIKVPDTETYEWLEKWLTDKAQVHTANKQRLRFSVSDISEEVRTTVEAKGCKAVVDHEYDMEKYAEQQMEF